MPAGFLSTKALKNLIRIDEIESLVPVMDMRIANLFDAETPQVFTACGRGPAHLEPWPCY